MGELIYSQQYIADFWEQGGGKALEEINNVIEAPWNVMGRALVEIVEKLG